MQRPSWGVGRNVFLAGLASEAACRAGQATQFSGSETQVPTLYPSWPASLPPAWKQTAHTVPRPPFLPGFPGTSMKFADKDTGA